MRQLIRDDYTETWKMVRLKLSNCHHYNQYEFFKCRNTPDPLMFMCTRGINSISVPPRERRPSSVALLQVPLMLDSFFLFPQLCWLYYYWHGSVIRGAGAYKYFYYFNFLLCCLSPHFISMLSSTVPCSVFKWNQTPAMFISLFWPPSRWWRLSVWLGKQ